MERVFQQIDKFEDWCRNKACPLGKLETMFVGKTQFNLTSGNSKILFIPFWRLGPFHKTEVEIKIPYEFVDKISFISLYSSKISLKYLFLQLF